MKSNIWYPYDGLPSSPVRRAKRGDAVASEASRNVAGELGKPPCGSRIPAPRCVETPRRCKGIACGLPPAELPGYAIVGVPYVGFHPLAGLLDHLGLENIRVLGGGGMGGLIAAQLAINHPDKVRSLFLGAGCARADNFLKTVMGVWKDLYDLDREIWARELALWVLTPETFNSRPDLADNAWKGRLAEDTFPTPGAFRRIADAYCAHDITDTLGRICCPTLVNCGGYEDLITGPRYAREMWARIPGAELAIQENTSHANWIEKDDEWGRLVIDWFART